MNIEDNDKIIAKHKHLFIDKFWGFETPDGWKRIIIDLMKSLEWHRVNNNWIDNPNFDESKEVGEGNYPCMKKPDGVNNIKLIQVKEKFGGLRVYYDVDNDKARNGIERSIARAEALAGWTCYKCGHLGWDVEMQRGYVVPICETCRKEEKK